MVIIGNHFTSNIVTNDIPKWDIPVQDLSSAAFEERLLDKNLYTPRHSAFLQLLRETRENAGLRQEEVADQLGKPQSFVSKYESGERRLDVLELFDVCQVLGVSLTKFCKNLERNLQQIE